MLYEIAGVLGVMPETLFSWTWRQLVRYAEGQKRARLQDELQRRKIAYIVASAHKKENTSMKWFDDFWPVEGMKRDKPKFKSKQEMLDHKTKLLKAWRIV